MSGVSELPASGHLSNPDVNTQHMAGDNKLVPSLALEHTKPDHPGSLLSDLRRQQEKGEFCDVVLHVNEEQFYGHRCVLAANGVFFNNVFTQNQTNEPHHLSFPTTTPSVLKSVLDFIYTGKLLLKLSDTDELLALCSTLEIGELKKICSHSLQKHLDITNWFQIRQLASKHNIHDVNSSVLDHLSENFAFVKDDNNLLNLDIKEIMTICKKCNISADKEIERDRFKLIFSWISQDYESRERYYAEIMQTVNPDNLNSVEIYSFLDQPHVKESTLRKHFVTHALIKFVCDRETFETEEAEASKETKTCTTSYGGDNLMTDDTKSETSRENCKAETADDEHISDTKSNSANTSPGDKQLLAVKSEVDMTKENAIEEGAPNLRTNIPLQVDKNSAPVRNKRRINLQKAVTREMKLKEEIKFGSKAKRGRPKKIPAATGTEQDTGLMKVTKIEEEVSSVKDVPTEKDSPIKSKKQKIKVTKQKTSATQTMLDEQDVKETIQSEIFLAPVKRPRSKKITSSTPRLQCPKCPRTFPTDCQLRHHMKGHGSDTPFLCDTCGFTTRHFGSMNVHRKLHDESQMLSCTWPDCSYKAIRRSRLEDHMNMHTGSKVYMCATCGKGFSGRKHLHRHEKLHVDTKPFTCEDCDYSSVRKDKLKDHIKKHHAQKAVEKGWLTEAEAARIKPSIRHRQKSGTTGTRKGMASGKGEKQDESNPSESKSPRKTPVHFESLVEELLKNQESQQNDLNQSDQHTNAPPTTRVVLQVNQQSNTASFPQSATLQSQQQVMVELPPMPARVVQPVSEQISPQMHPSSAQSQNSQNTSAQMIHVSQSAMLQSATEQVPQITSGNQVLQGPGPVAGSQTYHSIPNSSTISEEVYQFITYTDHHGRPNGMNAQCPSSNPLVSGQAHVDSINSLLTNNRQVVQNTQIQYQPGITPQRSDENNQWR